MFHKVQDVKAMPDFILKVDFINGICKYYDVKPLWKVWQPFRALEYTTVFLTWLRLMLVVMVSVGMMSLI